MERVEYPRYGHEMEFNSPRGDGNIVDIGSLSRQTSHAKSHLDSRILHKDSRRKSYLGPSWLFGSGIHHWFHLDVAVNVHESIPWWSPFNTLGHQQIRD